MAWDLQRCSCWRRLNTNNKQRYTQKHSLQEIKKRFIPGLQWLLSVSLKGIQRGKKKEPSLGCFIIFLFLSCFCQFLTLFFLRMKKRQEGQREDCISQENRDSQEDSSFYFSFRAEWLTHLSHPFQDMLLVVQSFIPFLIHSLFLEKKDMLDLRSHGESILFDHSSSLSLQEPFLVSPLIPFSCVFFHAWNNQRDQTKNWSASCMFISGISVSPSRLNLWRKWCPGWTVFS